MNALELLDILTSPDKFAAEMVAMSNSMGGVILLGVRDKTGEIIGLSYDELRDYNNKIGDIATNNIIPLIYVITEVVSMEDKKKILLVYITEGVNKPYKDKKLAVWVKQSSDKRRVTDNTEMLRLFQRSGNLYADEMEVYNTAIKDINENNFIRYFKKEFEEDIEATGLEYSRILNNLNILRNERLTLGGLLFFGSDPQRFKPAFCIKAVSFFGNDIGSSEYRDSKDIQGTIPEMFEKGMSFFTSNLKWEQKGQNFNSTGILEVSKIALEELLQNALVHRDYLKNAPLRLLIFDNRIEIISPGSLPNNLTVENIKFGNVVVRNNLLATFCAKTMNYRGLGSGIKRSLKEQPDIEFTNDMEGEQFIVTIPRKTEQ